MNQALRILRDRYDVAALVGIVVAVFFFPRGMPSGIFGLGVVGGGTLALHAIGLILVWRTNRIINFAQVQIGAVAATVFVVLARYGGLLRAVDAICDPCIDRVGPGLRNVNYFLSLGLSLGFAVLLGYVVHALVIRRFSDAPRLVATVGTIFVGEVLAAFQGMLPSVLTTESQRDAGLQLGAVPLPFDLTFTLEPADFHLREILVVASAAIAVAGLALYFRRSPTGIAIRAGAENPSRLATLGVDAGSVAGRVWMVVGALSGVAGVLGAMAQGAPGGGEVSFNVASLIRILAVAVIAGLGSLPIAAAAAVALGVLQAAFQWSFGSVTVFDGILVLVIGAVLVLQRRGTARAELEQASSWLAAREIRPTPPELRGLGVVRRWYRNLWIVGVLLLIGLPWLTSPRQTNLLGVVFIYGMVVLSLLVLTGWAGQISLGQFAFAAVGGYVAGTLVWPFPIPLLVAGVVGAVVAVVTGLPALKLRGLHLAIMTLAFALTTTSLLLNPSYLGSRLPSSLARPTLVGMSMEDQRVFYYVALSLFALVIAAVVGMRRSRTARALIAARDNEPAAQSFGINLTRARLGAFAVSGFVAAFAGALFALHQHGIQVQSFAPEVSVTLFLAAVIGGFGSVASTLVGVVYFGILLVFVPSGIVKSLATGAGGLAVLLMLPGGLGQGLFTLRDAVLRRIATRYRLIVPSLVADVADGVTLERSPIAPKSRTGRGTAFVPDRYHLGDQWALEATGEGAARGERGLRPTAGNGADRKERIGG